MFRIRFLFLLAFAASGSAALAQGVCVPENFTVNQIKGRTLAHLDRGDAPLRDIDISLAYLSKPDFKIKSARSSENGEFAFKGVRPGSYRLVTSYQGLKDFSLNVKVSRSARLKKNYLQIWLGAKFTEPCDGSYAEMLVPR